MTGIQAIPRTKGNTFLQLSARKLTLGGRSREEFLFFATIMQLIYSSHVHLSAC